MSLESRKRLWALFQSIYGQELTAESPRAAQPSWIQTPLLPHQSAVVAAALQLEKAKNGLTVGGLPGDSEGGTFFAPYGILGDPVGTGKSLIALSLVKAPPPAASYSEFIPRGGHLGDGRDVGLLRQRSQTSLFISGITLTPVRTALFILPHALVHQWDLYAKRDAPSLRITTLKRKQDALDFDLSKLGDYDAVLISSTIYTQVRHRFHNILWSRLFIDEADSIHITNNHDELNACFYWFITASFMNLLFPTGSVLNLRVGYPALPDTPSWLQRRVSALVGPTGVLSLTGLRHHNLVRRLCADGSSSSFLSINSAAIQATRQILHASADFIAASFPSPVVRHTNILCATPPNVRLLQQFISPEMLNRLNAGDMDGALEMAGISAGSKTEITTAVTASLAAELDNAKKTREFKSGLTYSNDASKVKALEGCDAKIASLESRIKAIQERIDHAGENNCPICYCDVSGAAVVPCCQQVLCFSCLCQCLQRVASCPLCRARISDLKTVAVLGTSSVPPATDLSGSNTLVLRSEEKPLNKRDTFVQYVLRNPGARILMFSSYDASFAEAFLQLENAGLHVAVLNGSGARISKLLRDFADGKYAVLFLNARNMGAGLNIEAASHVVLYHKMPAELEAQIVGRAMRLGRSADLEVVHLLHSNEMPSATVATEGPAGGAGLLTHV
jgi:SNF2 family DNA or RNA helicase